MPVIQLPKDTRWGDIGAGLGNLIGGVVQQVADKQVASGVSEIMGDASVSDADKPVQILKKYGDKGYSFYKEFVKTQVLQGELKNLLAKTGLTEIESRIRQQQLPFAAQKEQAGIAHTQATTAQSQAATARSKALLPSDVAAGQAQATSAQAKAVQDTALTPFAEDIAKAKTAGVVTQAATGAEELDRMRLQNADLVRTLQENNIPLPPTVGRSTEVAPQQPAPVVQAPEAPAGQVPSSLTQRLEPFTGLSPDDKRAAYEVYRAAERKKRGTGLEEMVKYATKRQGEVDKREAMKPADASEIKVAAASAEHGASASRFLKEFTTGGAQRMGSTKGAPITAFLEHWGVATGDPQIVSMINATKQQVASAATGGGGFFANGRVVLAKGVTPGITETPLYALIAMDEIADRELAKIDAHISGNVDPTTGRAIKNVEHFRKAREQWQQIKDVTGTLNSYVKPDPRYPNDPTRGETVMFFMGNQIDPKTFKTYITNDDKQYPLPGGESRPGSWFFEASKPPQGPDDKFHKNVDPWTLYRMLNPRAVPFADQRGTR